MERILRHVTQRLLVALLALALALVGFGHRAFAPDALILSAYAMPDGTLPELCIQGSGDQTKDHAPCPACTISAAMQLPQTVSLAAVELKVSQADWPATAQTLTPAHQARAPPARGPPVASAIT